LLHAECHRPADKPAKERLARHYYDLARLAKLPIGEKALNQLDLLERVIAHKSFFFAQSWAHYDTARPGTFRLLPEASRMHALRRDYEAMSPMIFGEVPAWSDIASVLLSLEERINHATDR
jgi:Nucleotidyl transferase AbiEii toxin, Type IV TA system